MNNHRSLLQLCRMISLLLTLGVSMNACATSTFTWKEEVLLHDGRKIVVERSDTYDSSLPHEIGQHAPLAEHTTTFAIPDANRTVIWKSDRRPLSEADGYYLLALDFLNGVPYAATRPAKCHTYDKWDRPNPPYVFFKYADGWKPILRGEFPEQFKINMVVHSLRHEPYKKKVMAENHAYGFVRAQTVAELNREPGASREFYVLLRQPMDLFGICPESTGPDGLPIEKRSKQ